MSNNSPAVLTTIKIIPLLVNCLWCSCWIYCHLYLEPVNCGLSKQCFVQGPPECLQLLHPLILDGSASFQIQFPAHNCPLQTLLPVG